MKAPRRSKALDPHTFAQGNVAATARFLEGPAEQAAARIVAEHGVLNIYAGEGASDRIEETQGPSELYAIFTAELERHAPHLPKTALEAIQSAAHEYGSLTLCTAYLVGVAVGRRIGPQSFAELARKAGAR